MKKYNIFYLIFKYNKHFSFIISILEFLDTLHLFIVEWE